MSKHDSSSDGGASDNPAGSTARFKASRRSVLGVSLGAAGLLGVTAWSWFRSNPEQLIAAIVNRRLGYLGASDTMVSRFATDYLELRSADVPRLAKVAILATPLRYLTVYPWVGLNHPLRRLEDNVVSNFLLSTNFFVRNGNQEPLTYVAFHDPGTAACRNPFHTPA